MLEVINYLCVQRWYQDSHFQLFITGLYVA